MYRMSYFTTPDVSVGVGGDGGFGDTKMLNFVSKIFVMGKALSGELSCMWTVWTCV